ncbi:MAG: hypothetical protein PVG49_17555 [Desulfobacteraceae bacterium]
MIDLHCHILPGVDDGPQNLDDSLAMARAAVADGIETIVATPHTLNGVYLNPVDAVRSGVDVLQDALDAASIPLRLYVGGDVHLVPDMMRAIHTGKAVTINDQRKYLLLELPSQSLPTNLKEEIFRLRIGGVTPIITHPERNMALAQDSKILFDLIEMGALVQVTAMSLTGGFGEFVRGVSERLLEQRLIQIIATDAHSLAGRPPVLSLALEAAADVLRDPDEALCMVRETPAAILKGDPVDIPEPRKSTRRFRLFRRFQVPGWRRDDA